MGHDQGKTNQLPFFLTALLVGTDAQQRANPKRRGRQHELLEEGRKSFLQYRM